MGARGAVCVCVCTPGAVFTFVLMNVCGWTRLLGILLMETQKEIGVGLQASLAPKYRTA